MTYQLGNAFEFAKKIAEMQKQFAGNSALLEAATKWQGQITLNKSLFAPAIQLSEQTKFATEAFRKGLLYRQTIFNFPNRFPAETAALAHSLARLQESMDFTLKSIATSFDNSLAVKIQEIEFALKSNINAIANSGAIFQNEQEVIGANKFAQRSTNLFTTIGENQTLTKVDLENAKQEIISYIKQEFAAKKILGFSAEFWIGAILSLLSIIITIHYAYHPPIQSDDNIRKKDFERSQLDIMTEIQKTQLGDTLKRFVRRNVWIRNSPKFSSKKVAPVRVGTPVYVINSNSGWAYITFKIDSGSNLLSGWLRKQDLKKRRPHPIAPCN